MKACKPDGSRWFAPTAQELMDRWLEEPQLLDWLRRTVSLEPVDPRELDQLLIDALLEPIAAPRLQRFSKLTACKDPRCPVCAAWAGRPPRSRMH